jgi:hypothetical protein
MDTGSHQGHEEYGQYLRADGAADHGFLHADFLHDFEASPVLISFGDLLVIHDQDCCHGEQDPKEDSDKEESAIYCKELHFKAGHRGCICPTRIAKLQAVYLLFQLGCQMIQLLICLLYIETVIVAESLELMIGGRNRFVV